MIYLKPLQREAILTLGYNAFGFGLLHGRTATALLERGHVRQTLKAGTYALTPLGWRRYYKLLKAEKLAEQRIRQRMAA